MMTDDDITDDPFSPLADPDRRRLHEEGRQTDASVAACFCHDGLISRRGVLILGGVTATLPFVASADAMVPCVQESQRVAPCKHKFCKHFGGGEDYYGR